MARYNYCFTYNNYTEEGEEELKSWLVSFAKYAIFGHEIAPTTGTPHLQGYMSLIKKSTMQAIQNKLQKLAVKLSLIFASGTAAQNRVYCTKDEKFWEHGELNITGHVPKKETVNDIYKEAMDAPNLEKAMLVIAEKRPRDYALFSDTIERSLRKLKPEYAKAIYDISMFNQPPLTFNKMAILLWGETNTGKTQYALAHFKKPLLVRHLDALSTFKDHDGIVFDDIELKNRPPNSIIHLLDWDCPSSIHIRYKVAYIPAETRKIFTSNLENPFYENNTEQLVMDAIERRLEKHNILNKLY